MKDMLGSTHLPLQIPIGSEDKFKGVVDLSISKVLFGTKKIWE